MSLHLQVTLTNAYQKVSDLVKAVAASAGLAEPRTCFTKIKYIYPDAGAAGVIYGSHNPSLSGYAFALRAPDEEELRQSQNPNVYSELTTDTWVKSTTNGDVLDIELHD